MPELRQCLAYLNLKEERAKRIKKTKRARETVKSDQRAAPRKQVNSGVKAKRLASSSISGRRRTSLGKRAERVPVAF